MATFIHTSSAGEGGNTTIYCTIDVESAGSSSSSTTYRFTLEDARQLTGQLEKLIFDALIENDPLLVRALGKGSSRSCGDCSG